MRNNLKSIALILASTAGIFTTSFNGYADTFYTTICEVNDPGPCIGNPLWTNGTVTAPVVASNGNNYILLFNGTNLGNNGDSTLNTRVRTTGGEIGNSSGSFQGDSITVNTNTDIRLKGAYHSSAVFTFTNSSTPSNPCLILNGGMVCVGDTDGKYTLKGIIQAVTGTASFFGLDDNEFSGTPGGGVDTITLDAQLTGSGKLWVVESESGTNLSTLFVANPANTFSGQWFIQSGVLQGTAPGSLGTNNITVDPLQTLPDNYTNAVAAPEAVFNPTYDINSSGTLTFNNGGRMNLHQTCSFDAMVISNTPLAAGTYAWAALNAKYPGTFGTTGSGSITVLGFESVIWTNPAPIIYGTALSSDQLNASANVPGIFVYYPTNGTVLNVGTNTLSAVFIPMDTVHYDVVTNNVSLVVLPAPSAPSFTVQPVNEIVAPGTSTTFSVMATGYPPPTYQWQFNGMDIGGATGSSYTVPSASLTNIGYYSVVIANSVSTNTSASVSLTFLNINMYAGLKIYGPIGANYDIQSISNLNGTNWTTLTNISLTTQPYIYIDYNSPSNANQFYRAVPR